MRSNLFLLLLLFIAPSFYAQVRLTGEVRHDGQGLDQVSIKVRDGDKILRTLAVNRRGKYETEIPFGKELVLTFTRPYMFPVSITIDTRMFEDLEQTLYEVPLNMSMFYRFEGMETRAFEQVIGSIKKTGMGDNAFSFVPNAEVIEALEPLQQESIQRLNAGEEPIDAEVVAYDETEDRTQYDAFEEERDISEVEEKFNKEVAEKSFAKETPQDEDESIALEANRRHQELTLEVQGLHRSAQHAEWQNERSAQEQISDQTIVGMLEMKAAKKAWAEQKDDEDKMLAEARVSRQERLVSLGANNASSTNTQANITQVIDFRIDDGTWLSEERLLILEGGKRVEYTKARYDWFFFEVITCSRNGEEIAEQEYEKVRALVDL